MNWLKKNSSCNLSSKKHTNFVILLFSMSLLAACDEHNESNNCDSTKFVDTGLQENLKVTLDTYLDANQDNNEPGLSIVIRKYGELVYRGNRGMANKLSAVAITNDTGFLLASVSKPFTAVAVMQLYEQELLTLDDKLISFIPELSNTWKDITIHHLLSHQSGIPDYINDDRDFQRINEWTNQDLIDFFTTNIDLEFTPGSQGDYSNTGYVLLAEIVARVSGESFGDYMQTHIFTPAGMINSYITSEEVALREDDALNFADRDTYTNHGIKLYTYGGGGQVSSANDLSMFAQAMSNSKLLLEETYTLMRQTHSVLSIVGVEYHFGYGTFSTPLGEKFSHGGRFDGFATLMEIDTLSETEIFILSNAGCAPRVNNIKRLTLEYFSK